MMKTILALSLLILTPMHISHEFRVIHSADFQMPLKVKTEWDLLYEAIVHVESRGRAEIVNPKTGAGGVIQILPKGRKGYLDEANRLLGYEKYKDSDRFCPLKSREIWDIVMAKRNADSCIDRAIYLHNPRGGAEYAQEIKTTMNNLKN